MEIKIPRKKTKKPFFPPPPSPFPLLSPHYHTITNTKQKTTITIRISIKNMRLKNPPSLHYLLILVKFPHNTL